jgi:hypothetical protein
MRLGLAFVVIGLALTIIGLVVVNNGSAGASTPDGSPWRLLLYVGPVLLAIGGVRLMSEARRRSM